MHKPTTPSAEAIQLVLTLERVAELEANYTTIIASVCLVADNIMIGLYQTPVGRSGKSYTRHQLVEVGSDIPGASW